jgi:hypothetical protein
MVSGSMTVKVAEASVDMLTPPCSPNSCLEVANAAAGSSHVEGMPVDNIAFLLATIQSSSPSCPVDDLFVGDFRHPHARTGGVLIVAQRRLKHTDTIIYVVRQIAYIHGRESILFRDRERIQ